MGQEIGEEAEPGEAERQLDRAHHQGEQQRQGHVAGRIVTGEGGHAGRHQQGYHGHGADGELARGAEQRVHHDRDERGVQPVDGRKAGDHGVGHPLRDEHDADRESGGKVRTEGGPAVGAELFCNREESGHERNHRVSVDPEAADAP